MRQMAIISDTFVFSKLIRRSRRYFGKKNYASVKNKYFHINMGGKN